MQLCMSCVFLVSSRCTSSEQDKFKLRTCFVQMFFDTMHVVEEGAYPFTVRASMKLFPCFENSVNQQGLALKHIRARLDTIFGKSTGPDGQIFLGQHEAMMSLNPTVLCTFAYVQENEKTHSRVRGCDLQLLMLLTPFILDGLYDDHFSPLEFDDDPSLAALKVFHNLVQWNTMMRLRGKDADEIARMDDLAKEFIDVAEETFKHLPMPSGKHLMSSNKIHRMTHGGNQTYLGGDRINFEPMAEMGHRKHIKGPQSLVCKSDTYGPGLLSIAERKNAVEEVLCGWQGNVACFYLVLIMY